LVSELVDTVLYLDMSHYNAFLSSTDRLESGLFTLKSSRAEPVQLSIVHGENQSGPKCMVKQ
jgi:hypothetical protein